MARQSLVGISGRTVLMVSALACCAAPAFPASAPPPPTSTLASIPLPHGAVRAKVSPGSFGAWLRRLKLRPPGTPVRLFNGKPKRNQGAHQAVVDIDLIGRNLQQCADAVLRLRAEYLWQAGRSDDVSFRLTNGMKVPWKRWSAGWRVKVSGGRHSRWVPAAKSSNRRAFRRYLRFIMAYAGTASIAKQLRRGSLASVQPGDVLVQPGFPGHAVMILDLARMPDGERLVILGQSFMPAQDFHVLRNVHRPRWTPWFRIAALKTGLKTPLWRPFRTRDLRVW